jgi:hypothetical protein
MAVSAAKLRKLDSENVKSLNGESLWVTIILEDSTELQGFFRHDAVADTVSVKVPGRRGRLKAYPLTDVNDIEITEAPKDVVSNLQAVRTVNTPTRQGRRTVTSIPDDGRAEKLGAAAKQLVAPAGVLCYLTGQKTDPRKDVAVWYEGNKYFITKEAFAPVLKALGLMEEDATEEAPVAKRRPGRPAGSKNTTVRRAKK